MDTVAAVAALGALAQDTRLRAFRLLVERGPEGLPAGQLAAALGVPPSSLTFQRSASPASIWPRGSKRTRPCAAFSRRSASAAESGPAAGSASLGRSPITVTSSEPALARWQPPASRAAAQATISPAR